MQRGRFASPYNLPDWMALYGFAPRRARPLGQPLRDTTDMLSQMAEAYNALYAPVMESLTRFWTGGAANPWTAPDPSANWPGQQVWPGGRTHKHGRCHEHRCDCGCDEGECDGCYTDDCHCRCCIHDADLVVHARLGERRIVPLTIENPRRRERQIKLELSSWTTRSGSPAAVKARLLPPTEFTLEPCQDRDLILLVEAEIQSAPQPAPGDVSGRQQASEFAGLSAAAPAGAADTGERRLPDVEQCEVYYADLRVAGCDVRPVRIALALLPRACASHPIDCSCGCC